jgi:signal transduction histidine kinase
MAYVLEVEDRLFASLDPSLTRETIARATLPEVGSWVVVDLLEATGEVVRLSIAHPDFTKKSIVDALNTDWAPHDDDPIGYPAARAARETVAISSHVDAALALAAHSAENHASLRQLGVGACLVVPIRDGDTIAGAMTFMSARPKVRFTPDDIALAQRLATACAGALANSRLLASANDGRTRAEHSDRAKSAMLGHVTHELRTPLSAIGGYAELLENGVRGVVNEAQQRDLQRIRWNQQHLLSLITQILEFVRVDTSAPRFTLLDVDLGEATREIADMLEPLIDEKGQQVRLDACETGSAVAYADSAKVRQIMINLLTNALKYSHQGNVVTIRCGSGGAETFAEVIDHGAGIPADKLDSIFQPFVQLSAEAGHREGGVGLGLAIARELARGMRGDLIVTSTLGEGSVFRLSLPSGGRARRITDAAS